LEENKDITLKNNIRKAILFEALNVE